MNAFDRKLKEHNCPPPRAEKVSILVVHVGYKCNLRCTHCYVDSSPDRNDFMSRETMDKILSVMKKHDEIDTLDLTGGAPELNPDYRYFVKSAVNMGKNVQVRSNLVIYSEQGMEDLPGFLADHGVRIFASLPHYEEESMDMQRGKGSYRKVIEALKKLNELGYGREGTSLIIDLEYNPLKTSFSPDQKTLEKVYRDKLMDMYGITFNNLITLNNAPLGRMRKTISDDEYGNYMLELESKFNPKAADNLMCSYYLSISPGGKLYDCGFMQILDVPIKDAPVHIDDFDYDALSKRTISTAPICFICTAGDGMNCFE